MNAVSDARLDASEVEELDLGDKVVANGRKAIVSALHIELEGRREMELQLEEGSGTARIHVVDGEVQTVYGGECVEVYERPGDA